MKHWLLRVSVNESRKLLRSFWRRVSVPLDDWRELAAPEHGERAELLEAVMALEPKYRLAIYLYYYEGLTVAETGRRHESQSIHGADLAAPGQGPAEARAGRGGGGSGGKRLCSTPGNIVKHAGSCGLLRKK